MIKSKDFLVSRVKADTNLPKDEVKKVINSLFENVSRTLSVGDNVSIRRFGTFKVVTRKAKIARNISKGEPMPIPEKKVVRFKSFIDVL